MKKILSVLMSAVMVLSLFSMLSITSFSEEVGGDFTYLADSDKSTCFVTGYRGEGTEITIPETLGGCTVIAIGDNAFAKKNISKAVLPDTVKSIGTSAFSNCMSLESINLPSGLEEIGSLAFYGCDLLKKIAVPETVTAIGEKAFAYSWNYSPNGEVRQVKNADFPIIGYEGSAAETYAKNNKLPFVKCNRDSRNCSYMYRLYNPNSGEHFYTASITEATDLIIFCWDYEGVGWVAPNTSSTPVYRLYNQNGGEHHYTTDNDERNILVSHGWRLEGVGWYSDDEKRVPVYRLYNPNAFSNNHNYTTSIEENDLLVRLGWKAEGIGWYGVA